MFSVPKIRTPVIALAGICWLLACPADAAAFFPAGPWIQERPLRQEPVADSSLINRDEMLVLTNGEVFPGRVTREGGRITIETPQGSRLVFAADRIDFICHSLEEAYWEKYSRLGATDVRGQVGLFQWCLKHQLFDQADNQLQLLMQSKISAVELNHLNRQLGVSRAKHTAATPATVASQSGPAPDVVHRLPGWGQSTVIDDSQGVRTANWTPPSTATIPLPAPDSPVDQANFTEAIDPQNDMPDSRELQHLMRDLPAGIVGNFRRRVEPLLKQQCATCHREQAAPTLEFGGGQVVNALPLSQRNLYRWLPFASAGQAGESPLWVAATQPHGGQADALIDPSSRQAMMIRQWLNDWQAVAAMEPEFARAATPAATSENASAVSPRPDPATRPDADLPTIGEIPQLSQAQLDDRPPLNTDPYDPEAFNRQYHR